MKKLTLLLIVCIALLAGCKKESGPTTKTETPAKTTISNALVVDTGRIANNGSFEFGQKFYVSKNGSVTKLGCKMARAGSYRVSLWDFATTNLIAATTVNVTDTLNFFYNSVSGISLTASTRYVISLNNTDGGVNKPYYLYSKKPGTNNVNYPFTTGSVTYEIGLYSFSTTSVFPTTSGAATDAFWGVPDMQFEYSE